MSDDSKITELAYEAGAILLENGAEISRVDETMQRIAEGTRLLDALLSFFCISTGVALAFMLDAAVSGTMQHLETLTAAPETAGMFVQLLAQLLPPPRRTSPVGGSWRFSREAAVTYRFSFS